MQWTQSEVESVRSAGPTNVVRKDECAYSFATPETLPSGLFVCLSCFLGLGADYAHLHTSRTGHAFYLNIVRTKVLKPQPTTTTEEAKAKPTVLGIGIDGGFSGGNKDESKYTTQETLSVAHLSVGAVPSIASVPLTDMTLPPQVSSAAISVLLADSAEKKEEIKAWVDENKCPVSKFAENLLQINSGKQISSEGPWKCEHPGCTVNDNLWLNLSDGSIMCGRSNALGLGNGHALQHYEQTAFAFPLVVKLGTVTPEAADVYSYSEDEMICDPWLEKHLAHFGMERSRMTKTGKTMAELSIDVQFKLEEMILTQSAQGEKREPLFGPGLTGLKNIGNSCFLAATMQALFALEPFRRRFCSLEAVNRIFTEAPADPHRSLVAQLAKLGYAMESGIYSKPVAPLPGEEEDKNREPFQAGIPPRTFKAACGILNSQWANKHQQDAAEFFQWLLQEIEKSERGQHAHEDPSQVFKFALEDKLTAGDTKKVRYTQTTETVLSLPIPLERATNLAEVAAYEIKRAAEEAEIKKATPGSVISLSEVVKPVVPLTACLDAWSAEEQIEGSNRSRRVRMGSFPPYLAIQLRRYLINPVDMQPKKIDALVEMPEELTLEALRGTGVMPGEELLDDASITLSPKADPRIVDALVGMGFSSKKSAKAALAVKNSNIDAAAEWIFAHMDEPDEEEPAGAPQPTSQTFTQDQMDGLCAMGFTEAQVKKALTQTNGNVDRAADWLLSHIDSMDLDEPEAAPAAAVAPKAIPANTDSSKYELVGFISHMGRSTGSGHYVAHIKKDGRWVFFNDEKVVSCASPPRQFGFLYLYKRV